MSNPSNEQISAEDRSRPNPPDVRAAERALRVFDRETRAWELGTREARVDDTIAEAELGTHMLIALMLAFVVAAACLALDIVARLPHPH